MKLIDQFGASLKPSYIKHMGLKPEIAKSTKHLILENNITGCTVSVDRKILGKAVPIPQEMPNHDHWLGLITTVSGNIKFIDEGLTLYRQHNQNTIGGKNLREASWNYKHFVFFRTLHQKKLLSKTKALSKYLERNEGDQRMEEIETYLSIIASDSYAITKVYNLWTFGFRCQTLRGNLLLLISLFNTKFDSSN